MTEPRTVAVTGSTGLIGSHLVPRLREAGHTVVRFVRGPVSAPDERSWSPSDHRLDPADLADVDAVVHLAGVGVADKRWTAERKALIRGSRVDGTTTLSRAIAAAEPRPRVLLSSSAVGFYGDTGDTVLDERGPSGGGFLAEVCRAWEAATAPAEDAGHAGRHLRTGVVLAADGGALAAQMTIFKACLGAPLGSGRQWLPWIALSDEVAAIAFLLDADVSGPVNLVAPNPVTNKQFTKAFGARRCTGRPCPSPYPGVVLRLAIGDFAEEGLLAGQRLRPAVLQQAGFGFAHPDLPEAL